MDRIREERPQLEEMRVGRKYFPFELGEREPQPVQGYLFKLPAAFVELFPELDEVPRGRRTISARLPSRGRDDTTGALTRAREDFVPRDEDVRSRQARPWLRDPSEVDRALSSHARIERLVAEAAIELGWRAVRMQPGDPPFDLMLTRPSDGLEVVVEAKSTTTVNEEKQLRLALGQVLRYRQVLQTRGGQVEAMIAVEKELDESWIELCKQMGVLIAWPSAARSVLQGVD